MANFPASKQLIDNPNTYADGPLRLTSVFPIKEIGPHEILSGVQYEIDNCGYDYLEVSWASYGDCIHTAEKEFTEGLLFTENIDAGQDGHLGMYTALKCRPGSLGGGDEEDYRARAERRLKLMEASYLERELTEWQVAQEGGDLGPSDTIEEGIALLLSQAGALNNPVLHLPIRWAFHAAEKLAMLEAFGVGLVVSPVYTQTRAFITGGINIWGSEIQTSFVPDVTNNQMMALAERQYLMTVECAHYSTTVAL